MNIVADYHQSFETKLAELGIEATTSCSKVLYATDSAIGPCSLLLEYGSRYTAEELKKKSSLTLYHTIKTFNDP